VKPYFQKEVYDYQLTPFYVEVTKMIDAYKPVAPIAYGLDVGVIIQADGANHKVSPGSNALSALVEINDGICLGNYGLDPIHYAEMISSRWMELTTKGKV
jgi:hypothetical protein